MWKENGSTRTIVYKITVTIWPRLLLLYRGQCDRHVKYVEYPWCIRQTVEGEN